MTTDFALSFRFAAAIAARLNAVLPPDFSVRAKGANVDVYARGQDRHASVSAKLLASDDGRSLTELMEVAAQGILDGAQDGIMEILTEEWPLGSSGRAAEPGTRVVGDRLLMWFGEEDAPIIALQPLPIAEILEGAA